MRIEAADTNSDSGLMVRVAAGDMRAFEAIYDRYRAQALGLAMRMTKHSALAEDVTQEAFLNLWRSAARFEPSRGSLKAWLLQIVHNRGVDELRRGARGRHDVALDDVRAEDIHAPECVDVTVLERDDARQLRNLLGGLPTKQREVVELAYYQEWSHVEMADGLDLPLGTVKGRLRLAHTKLRRRLLSV